jgi:hypothetical protein
MTSSPHTDDHTAGLIDNALETLANLRGLPCPHDPGNELHLHASLAYQIRASLVSAVHEARRHDHGWDEIAELLGTSTAKTRHRYDPTHPEDPAHRRGHPKRSP